MSKQVSKYPTRIPPYAWQPPLLHDNRVWLFYRGWFYHCDPTCRQARAELKRLQNPDQLEATLKLYANCVYLRDVLGHNRFYEPVRVTPQAAESKG